MSTLRTPASNKEIPSNEVVVTGIGAVTASGVGFAEQWRAARAGTPPVAAGGFSLATFQPAPHLSERRMLKAVSKVDALGLVAIESLMRDAELKPGMIDPERIGLYVGAPPASSHDNEFYVDSIKEAYGSVREFGRTCMSSRPTTLLVGLPNNVLCYGAMLLEARGPNSNYTASSMSGVMALINAARRVARGQLTAAIAGGFAMHRDDIDEAIYRHLALELPVADGAAFVALETRAGAEGRGRQPLASIRGGVLSSDGLGPRHFDGDGRALAAAVAAALRTAGARADAVGLVMVGVTGDAELDRSQLATLARALSADGAAPLPALATATPALGCLMESSGVLEVGLAAELLKLGEIPNGMVVAAGLAAGFSRQIAADRPLALVVVTTAWGEYGVLALTGPAQPTKQ